MFNGSIWVPMPVTKEDEMTDFQVTYKAHNVNSKRLLQRFVSTVEETAQEFIVQRSASFAKVYDFSQLVSYLEALLEEMVEDKIVNRYDIVGDYRNNPLEELRNGSIKIEIKFQQFNCINITKIMFLLSKPRGSVNC